MTLRFRPSDAVIGAEVEGLALDRAPDAENLSLLEAALERFGVLIWRDQEITPAQQIAFSQALGPLEKTELATARLKDHEEILVVGNTGEKLVTFSPLHADGELEWHTDHIHHKVPARASLLYALEVPSQGGDTLFACMYSAYDALTPAQQAAYQRLEVVNSVAGISDYLTGQGYKGLDRERLAREMEAAIHPLVRAHPLTGRKALYFGNQVSVGILGWAPGKARQFILELTEHACRPAFRYRHQWRKGDAVLWDNRRVLHAGTTYDTKTARRTLHRTTLRETHAITLPSPR